MLVLFSSMSRRGDDHALFPEPRKVSCRDAEASYISAAVIILHKRPSLFALCRARSECAVTGAPNAELRMRTPSAGEEARREVGRCTSTACSAEWVKSERGRLAGCDSFPVDGVAHAAREAGGTPSCWTCQCSLCTRERSSKQRKPGAASRGVVVLVRLLMLEL